MPKRSFVQFILLSVCLVSVNGAVVGRKISDTVITFGDPFAPSPDIERRAANPEDSKKDIETFVGQAMEQFLVLQNAKGEFIAENAWRGLQVETTDADVPEGTEEESEQEVEEEDDSDILGGEEGGGGEEPVEERRGLVSMYRRKKKKDADAQEALANNDIFHLLDRLSWIKADHVNFFSQQYIEFIQDISDIFNTADASKEDQKKLDTATTAQTKYCQDRLGAALDGAIEAYNKKKGKNIKGDPEKDTAFTTWVSTGYTPYRDARNRCQLANNQYNTMARRVYGKHFAVFSAAQNNIIPLTDSASANVPGLTMKLGQGGNLNDPQAGGNLVPYYAIPGLKGTVAAWRANSKSNKFSYKSTSKSGSVDSHEDKGGGGISLGFSKFSIEAGGRGSTKTTSTKMEVKNLEAEWFGATMVIQRGIWFDGFRTASTVANLDGINARRSLLNLTARADDDGADAAARDKERNEKAKPIFEKWMGTKESPGPAAEYADIALLIYRPSFKFTFGSQETFQEFKTRQATSGGCFLFICANGDGGGSDNKTTFDDETMSVSFKDLSPNVYYAGSIKGSFWTSGS